MLKWTPSPSHWIPILFLSHVCDVPWERERPTSATEPRLSCIPCHLHQMNFENRLKPSSYCLHRIYHCKLFWHWTTAPPELCQSRPKNKRLWRRGNLHTSRRDIASWSSTLTNLWLEDHRIGKLILFPVKPLQLQQNRAVIYGVSVTRYVFYIRKLMLH